jgi:type IV secretion system protein TrbI
MSTADEALLDPNSSPKALSKKAGVRRVNNMPLYLAGSALVVFVAVVAMVAWDRAAQQNAGTEEEAAKVASTRKFASEITGKAQGAVVPPELPPVEAVAVPAAPPADPAPAKTAPAERVVPVVRLDVPPLPTPRQGGGSLGTGEEAVSRQDRARQQSLEQALKARTGVQLSDNRNRAGALTSMGTGAPSPSAVTPNAALAAYQSRLSQVRAAGLGGGAPAALPLGEAVR